MAETTIDDLNDDCLMEIFSYLSLIETTNVHQVCSRWEALSEQLRPPTCLIWGKDGVFYFGRKNWKRHQPYNCVDDVIQILKCFGENIERYYIINRVVDDGVAVALMRAITKYCKNIKEIKSNAVAPSIEIFGLIGKCTNLEVLKLKYIDEDNDEALIVMLTNKKKLKFLSVEFPQELNDSIGKFLEYLPKSLEELCIMDADNLLPLYVISALKSHNLRRLTYNSYYGELESHMIISTICDIKTLEYLKLYSPTCHPYSFNLLSKLVHIRKLVLAYCRDLGDYSLTEIVNACKQLELLDIKRCTLITDHGLSTINGLKKLEELDLSGLIEMTDNSIDYLPNSLKKLSLRGCIHLNDFGMTKLIRNIPNLAQLNIPECPGITVKTILTALEETKTRTNDIVLEIYIDRIAELTAEIKRHGQDVNTSSPNFRIDCHSNYYEQIEI